MSENDFLNAVTAAFRRLVDQGLLTIVSSKYDEKAFGNAVVMPSGGNVLIRLVHDRGDIFADAASAVAPEEWAPLERVLVAVGVSAAPPERLLTLAEAASLVEQHMSALSTGLGETRLGDTRTRLAEIRRFKTAEAMHRLEGHKR